MPEPTAANRAEPGPLPDIPWDRLPDESGMAYKAFCCYLECGPFRTLDRVGELLYPGKAGRKRGATGRIFAWSRRHRWVERARAFDRPLYLDKLDQIRKRQQAEHERRFSFTG